MKTTSRFRRGSVSTVVAPVVAVVALLALWQGVVSFGIVPRFMLPGPVDVVEALVEDADLLASHAVVTLSEAAAGLVLGVAAGFVLAVLMDRFDLLYKAFEPLIIFSQTIPTVAIAPVLVLWLGYGMLPKIVLVIITTFFPITVALSSGFKQTDPDVIDLMRTMGASRTQIFIHAKLPSAMDSFFSGLRISATYAIVGAVVAEWLGGFEGLGIYMQRVRKSYSYDSMFASIIIISALSLVLMGFVSALERICMPWKHTHKKKV